MARPILRRPPVLPWRRWVNRFLDQLSTLLLFFGLALLVVGLLVQGSRIVRMRTVRTAAAPPAFGATLHRPERAPDGMLIAPALSPEPTVHPTPGTRPVRIVIPGIGVDTPVVEVGVETRIVNGDAAGNEWQTADYAAGYHEGSALLGEVGNTVLSGHNNVKGAVFRDIYKLVPGDEFYVYDTAGKRFAYRVEESFVVQEEGATPDERRDNTQWIRHAPDERVTLVTCFPPWSNTHRAIVVAFPAPASTTAAGSTAATPGPSTVTPMPAAPTATRTVVEP
jgi:sortase A